MRRELLYIIVVIIAVGVLIGRLSIPALIRKGRTARAGNSGSNGSLLSGAVSSAVNASGTKYPEEDYQQYCVLPESETQVPVISDEELFQRVKAVTEDLSFKNKYPDIRFVPQQNMGTLEGSIDRLSYSITAFRRDGGVVLSMVYLNPVAENEAARWIAHFDMINRLNVDFNHTGGISLQRKAMLQMLAKDNRPHILVRIFIDHRLPYLVSVDGLKTAIEQLIEYKKNVFTFDED